MHYSFTELFHKKPDKESIFYLETVTQNLLKSIIKKLQKDVEEILKENSSQVASLVLKKVYSWESNVRWWDSVSTLEFAAWAGDIKVLNLLLDSLPNANHREALAQLENLEQRGCQHGKPFAAFEPLFSAYQDNIDKYDSRSFEERNIAAVKGIGEAQRLLPSTGVQWYCDPEPFCFYNWEYGNKVGSHYFMFKDKGTMRVRDRVDAAIFAPGLAGLKSDAAGLRQFYNARRLELDEILKRLRIELNEPSSVALNLTTP